MASISRCRDRCANRFVHLELEADLDDWCKWAVKARVRPEIIAFCGSSGFVARSGYNGRRQRMGPLSALLGDGLDVLCGVAKRPKRNAAFGTSEFEAQLLDGTVGEGAASELIGFLRQFRQLPSIDEILLNPATAPVPSETSAQIAVATALGRVMTDNSIGRGLTYLDRCRPRCASWPSATRPHERSLLLTRRSSFSSAWITARYCNDYRTR